MSEEMTPMTGPEIPESLRAVEHMLAGLAPAPARIDRDQLMFEAGRAAGAKATKARGLRLWKGICGGLVLACAGMAVFPRTRVVERVVMHVAPPGIRVVASAQSGAWAMRETSVRPDSGGIDASYLLLRQQVLMSGNVARGSRGAAGGGGGGEQGTFVPVLLKSEGFDALSGWQRQSALFGFGGNRS